MKVLHKFIIKSYLGPMVLTFFIVLFIFLMQFIWLHIDDIVGKGLPWSVILEFMGWASLVSIPFALPLSTLFASLMTMGNLGENNELLALKAAGISLQRILRPMFVLIIFVAVIAFFAGNNLIPYANLKMRSLYYDIRKTRLELTIPENMFFGLSDFSMRIDKKDPKTNLLKNMMIYDHKQNKGNTKLVLADSGYIKQTPDQRYLVITLYSGKSYEEQLDNSGRNHNQAFSRRWFDELTEVISLGNVDFTRTDESLFKDFAQTQNIVQLNHTYDSLVNIQKYRAKDLGNQIVHTTYIFEGSQEFDTIQDNRLKFYYQVNVDSVFQDLSTREKSHVYDWALQRAENATNHMDMYVGEYEIRQKQVINAQLEWHRKFALSVACIVFFFIGAPLGAIIRKGGLGTPMVVSVLFFVVYWVIDITCKKMAQNNVWNPILATWFSSLALAPIGIFLTYKATSDSSLFNPERYLSFFNKLFGRVSIVNLDLVKPSGETPENEVLISEVSDLTKMCIDFLQNNSNIYFKPSKIRERDEKLFKIKEAYQHNLSDLASIEGDERLRENLRQYLELDVEKNKLGTTKINKLILIYATMVVIFPIGIVFLLNRTVHKFKIKRILREITNINNSIELILMRKNG